MPKIGSPVVESSTSPNQRVGIYDGATLATIIPGSSDGLTATRNGLTAQAWSFLYNNTSWDRRRSNYAATVLAAANRTASVNSSNQTNHNAKGVVVILDINTAPGAETLTAEIQVQDPVSGDFQAYLTGSAQSATGITMLVCYPGASFTTPATIDVASNNPLPRTWRVAMTHSAGGTWNYSVAVEHIV